MVALGNELSVYCIVGLRPVQSVKTNRFLKLNFDCPYRSQHHSQLAMKIPESHTLNIEDTMVMVNYGAASIAPY